MTEELENPTPASAGNEPVTGEPERIAALERLVAEKESRIAELEARLTVVSDELSQSVASYRHTVIRLNPEVPEDLISGESVAVLEQSLAQAKGLVNRVKQGLEAEIKLARVPAGAPPRLPPDLSSLSSREKIQYSIGGK